MDEIKYTQNEDGSRSYNFTLTAEQLQSDQFLGNMKDGADLFKSWNNQKSLIGKNNFPGAEASEEDWAKAYEKTRPANGYDITDETLKKFAHDNGFNKYQANNFAKYVESLSALPAEETGDENLGKMFTEKFGDKAGEKIAIIDKIMEQSFSDQTKAAFQEFPNSVKLSISSAINDVLEKFGVKGTDFQIGNGGQPTPVQSDRAGYEKARSEAISKGAYSDLQDKALRKQFNVPYIDITSIFNQ